MRETTKSEWLKEAERYERLASEASRQVVSAKPAGYYLMLADAARRAASGAT